MWTFVTGRDWVASHGSRLGRGVRVWRSVGLPQAASNSPMRRYCAASTQTRPPWYTSSSTSSFPSRSRTSRTLAAERGASARTRAARQSSTWAPVQVTA